MGETPDEIRKRKSREASKRYRERYPEKVKEKNKRYYVENTEQEKARVRKRRAEDPEFTRRQNRESVARFRARNPEAARAILKRYEERNPEKVREWGKLTNQRYRAKNHELVKERGRIAAAKKRASLTEEQWEMRRAKNREYMRTHRAKASAYTKKRRAIKKGARTDGPMWTLLDLAQRDGWRCHICGQKVPRDAWSEDHLVPLSKGGSHSLANVALAHRVCNSRRGAGRLPAQLRLLG